MDDLNQTGHQLSADYRELFFIAASYSWITPLVSFGVLIWKIFYGPFCGSADDGTRFTDDDADREFYFVVECVLLSCLASGIVTLCGIYNYMENQIRSMAIIGVVLSLGMGFLTKAVQFLSHMVVG